MNNRTRGRRKPGQRHKEYFSTKSQMKISQFKERDAYQGAKGAQNTK